MTIMHKANTQQNGRQTHTPALSYEPAASLLQIDRNRSQLVVTLRPRALGTVTSTSPEIAKLLIG